MPGMERQTIDKSKLQGKKIIWIMGGPGSGRGTQCEKLALKYKYKHLSSGDLLRHEVMSGSQRGGNLYKLMANGDTVPNGIVNDVIAEAMVKSADGNDAFLIDGYPLDDTQANDFVSDIGSPTAVVCLEIPDEVAIGRLSSRGNFDDDAAAIEKRLKVWNDKTKPVAAKHKAFFINADRSANEIVTDIEKALN